MIPETVKIQGKTIGVTASARGYVKVGETLVEMDFNRKLLLQGAENISAWQAEVQSIFEQALKLERKRIKFLSGK